MGTAVNISHLAPTPVGCSITATAVSVAGTEREVLNSRNCTFMMILSAQEKPQG